MTLPARISEESWLSYDSSGNSYTSTDLIVWSAIASVDGLLPTGYVMKILEVMALIIMQKKVALLLKRLNLDIR